ncbi:MAG: alpha/beta hydrolase [Pseudomonadales bacterium]
MRKLLEAIKNAWGAKGLAAIVTISVFTFAIASFFTLQQVSMEAPYDIFPQDISEPSPSFDPFIPPFQPDLIILEPPSQSADGLVFDEIVNIQNVSVSQDGNFSLVRVFFGTNRNQIPNPSIGISFGVDRGQEIVYGKSFVTIPREHRLGELESPSIWKLEFSENPNDHVMVMHNERMGFEDFFADLNAQIASSLDNSALIFLHGCCTTFEDAARRTAQMSYDLGFPGAPIFFSWPSKGEEIQYTVDGNTIEWAKPQVKEFLETVIVDSMAQNVFIIAHSMGAELLGSALSEIYIENPNARNWVSEIILAAPDIDRQIFQEQIAPVIGAANAPVTLYASSNDRALRLSREVNGEFRAGDASNGIVIADGVESIDASNADTSLIGHSYYGDTRSILGDIFDLVRNRTRPDSRFQLRPVNSPEGKYWEYRP